MKVTDLFDTSKYNFGDIEESDVVPFNFNILGNIDDIHYVAPACGGCTDVWIDKTAKRISGVFRASAAMTYAEKETTVAKGITVYLDPEEHEFIADAKTGVRKRNFKKRNFVLTLNATVHKVEQVQE